MVAAIQGQRIGLMADGGHKVLRLRENCAAVDNKAPVFRPGVDLPEGWTEVAADDGRVYYWHEATNETTWEWPETSHVGVAAARRSFQEEPHAPAKATPCEVVLVDPLATSEVLDFERQPSLEDRVAELRKIQQARAEIVRPALLGSKLASCERQRQPTKAEVAVAVVPAHVASMKVEVEVVESKTPENLRKAEPDSDETMTSTIAAFAREAAVEGSLKRDRRTKNRLQVMLIGSVLLNLILIAVLGWCVASMMAMHDGDCGPYSQRAPPSPPVVDDK